MDTTDLLTLTQWLSPSYPVGAFSYSHGLETAISDGRIANASDLEAWLRKLISHGSGWNDLVLLAAAYRAENDTELGELSALAEALCVSRERLFETTAQGRAFVRTTNAVWGTELTEAPYSVAVGAATAAKNIALETTSYLYLQSVISNLVSVAVRLVPLGQTEGQACLQKLADIISDTAKTAINASLDDIGGCTFALDIASMRHETQTTRIFQT